LLRPVTAAALALATSLLLAASAPAAVIAPYDGQNPFRCKVQNAGLGVAFPNPAADPFCVKYDKTQQNVTDFGIVDFLLLEPARVLAAAGKCFYNQTDHWTGWVIQDGQPELWNWKGNYFFDLARGIAGAHMDDLRIGGEPADPRSVPGFPAEYLPYFQPGGGGVYTDTVAALPHCAARVDTPEEARHIYRPDWRYPE
jgi:hypothetical protein